jgi:hypothetical protein
MFEYPEWEAVAKRDDQMAVINKLDGSDLPIAKGLVFSWIVHYDSLTKVKTPIDGYAVYSQDTNEIYISINSPEFNTLEEWTLSVHGCKATGANKPSLIATNVDLVAW